MTNEETIKAYLNCTHYNTTKKKALSIRDGKLYSYSLLISERDNQDNFIVYDYMATGLRGMRSTTTSQHVSLIKRSAPQRLIVLA
jgi:hypothetical protein